MQYTKKSFSVCMQPRKEDVCVDCGRPVKTGYDTQIGLVCSRCYAARKKNDVKIT